MKLKEGKTDRPNEYLIRTGLGRDGSGAVFLSVYRGVRRWDVTFHSCGLVSLCLSIGFERGANNDECRKKEKKKKIVFIHYPRIHDFAVFVAMSMPTQWYKTYHVFIGIASDKIQLVPQCNSNSFFPNGNRELYFLLKKSDCQYVFRVILCHCSNLFNS